MSQHKSKVKLRPDTQISRDSKGCEDGDVPTSSAKGVEQSSLRPLDDTHDSAKDNCGADHDAESLALVEVLEEQDGRGDQEKQSCHESVNYLEGDGRGRGRVALRLRIGS